MASNRFRSSDDREGRSRSRTGMGATVRGQMRPVARATRQFWVLAVMLCLALVLGGSSRPDVASLPLLRPLSIMFLAYGVFSLPLRKVRQYRWLFGVTGALVLLHIVHLVPLPAGLWSAMPGREIVVQVDRFLGVNSVWRPLTMDPEGGWNALYALALPIAALVLGAGLTKEDHVRLVMLLALLIALSGLLGVLQTAGSDWHRYPRAVGATGLFANRNHQAALLAIFFPLLAVSVATSNDVMPNVRHGRIIGWLIGAVTVPLILVTGSRAGLLLLIVAVIGILAARLYRPPLFPSAEGRFARLRSPWVLGSLAVLAATGLAWLVVVQARGVAIDRLQSSNFELRWPVWQGAWDIAKQFWPIGSGLGSYEPVYQIYEPAELLRPTYSNHVHNDWLEFVMTGGLPGVVLLVCAIGLFGYALTGSLKARGTASLLRRLGLLTTLLLALASVVDYPVRVPFVACVFALGWVWSFVGWGEHAR